MSFLGILIAAPLWAATPIKTELLPPSPPVRQGVVLATAADVALDAARSLAFLEQGKAYYEAFPKESRDAEENRAYLTFLDDYAREADTLKRELEVLRLWTEKKAPLTN